MLLKRALSEETGIYNTYVCGIFSTYDRARIASKLARGDEDFTIIPCNGTYVVERVNGLRNNVATTCETRDEAEAWAQQHEAQSVTKYKTDSYCTWI